MENTSNESDISKATQETSTGMEENMERERTNTGKSIPPLIGVGVFIILICVAYLAFNAPTSVNGVTTDLPVDVTGNFSIPQWEREDAGYKIVRTPEDTIEYHMRTGHTITLHGLTFQYAGYENIRFDWDRIHINVLTKHGWARLTYTEHYSHQHTISDGEREIKILIKKLYSKLWEGIEIPTGVSVPGHTEYMPALVFEDITTH